MSATQTREQILKAADNLFGDMGFDAASTREIAAQSGVNKALIHYHFKTKEALFEAVMERYYQRLNATLFNALQAPGTMRDKMLAVIDAYFDFLSQNLRFSRIVQREGAGERHMDIIRRHLLPTFRTGLDLIQGAYPATRDGDLAADQLYISFYGMIVGYFTYSGILEQILEHDPLSPEALERRKKHIHRLLDIIEKDLGQRP